MEKKDNVKPSTPPREKSGFLFKNNNRETENMPHYKGNVMVEGQEYWLSAWVKESANGNKYMSLALSPRESRSADSKPLPKNLEDSDIPF